jgi:hypothetical protein
MGANVIEAGNITPFRPQLVDAVPAAALIGVIKNVVLRIRLAPIIANFFRKITGSSATISLSPPSTYFLLDLLVTLGGTLTSSSSLLDSRLNLLRIALIGEVHPTSSANRLIYIRKHGIDLLDVNLAGTSKLSNLSGGLFKGAQSSIRSVNHGNILQSSQ